MLVDLPVFGRPSRLVWSKRRWVCPNPVCAVGVWTEQDPQIASKRCALTTRAGRWVTVQVGGHGRSVAYVTLPERDGDVLRDLLVAENARS